jgi:hypothetical protein
MVEPRRFAHLSCPSFPDYIRRLAVGAWDLYIPPDYMNNVAGFRVWGCSHAENGRFPAGPFIGNQKNNIAHFKISASNPRIATPGLEEISSPRLYGVKLHQEQSRICTQTPLFSGG